LLTVSVHGPKQLCSNTPFCHSVVYVPVTALPEASIALTETVEDVAGVGVHVSLYTAVNVVAAVIENALNLRAEPVLAQWSKV
jgi:hypothetical protein